MSLNRDLPLGRATEIPALLTALSAIVLAIGGLTTRVLADWWLENVVIGIFFALIAWKWRQSRVQLSAISLWMLFLLFCLHEYGAAHAYLTPLGEWVRASAPALAAGRNPYDRLIHLLYGVLTVRAFQDLSEGGSRWQAWQGVVTTSALYEVAEWLVAAFADPALGAEFVGAQGDEFDAAKDMALACLGSALVLPFLRKRQAARVYTACEN